jgi:hypothetical protein
MSNQSREILNNSEDLTKNKITLSLPSVIDKRFINVLMFGRALISKTNLYYWWGHMFKILSKLFNIR